MHQHKSIRSLPIKQQLDHWQSHSSNWWKFAPSYFATKVLCVLARCDIQWIHLLLQISCARHVRLSSRDFTDCWKSTATWRSWLCHLRRTHDNLRRLQCLCRALSFAWSCDNCIGTIWHWWRACVIEIKPKYTPAVYRTRRNYNFSLL